MNLEPALPAMGCASRRSGRPLPIALRAAAPCLGVMMLAMLFSAGEPTEPSAALPTDQPEAADFESVMLALSLIHI